MLGHLHEMELGGMDLGTLQPHKEVMQQLPMAHIVVMQ